VATQVRIALVPRGHGLPEFFLEPVKRVIDDLGMQHSLLQSSEELALEIQSANQQTIRANLVASLRMHGATVARILTLAASAGNNRDAASALGAHKQTGEEIGGRSGTPAALPFPDTVEILYKL